MQPMVVVLASRVVNLDDVHDFLAKYVAAFGYSVLTPKAHWLLHYPIQLLKRIFRINCFVLERKHRVPKQYAELLKKHKKKGSTSILSDVVCHHLVSLKRAGCYDFEVGLVNGTKAPKKAG